MKLTEEVKVIFKNSKGDKQELTITIDELLDSTKDDLYEMLEESVPCTSSSCNNESQNFCDCGPNFEDYLIDEILYLQTKINMEKEKEFFEKMRSEKIDNLIKKLNELKNFGSMCAFRTDRDFYKKDIDDIFNSFDDGNNYIAMKKLFEQN